MAALLQLLPFCLQERRPQSSPHCAASLLECTAFGTANALQPCQPFPGCKGFLSCVSSLLCCMDFLHKKHCWLSWRCFGSRTPCAARAARPLGQLRIGLQPLTSWLSTGGYCGRVLCVVTDVTISYNVCKSTHLTQSILEMITPCLSCSQGPVCPRPQWSMP